ncbi:hypothetical protein GCM10010174_44540 [Kutzneria viridogrisea]
MCTHSSCTRSQGTWCAGIARPEPCSTSACQAASPSPVAAAPNRPQAASRSSRSSHSERGAPSSIAVSRSALLVYMGCSTPVRAQVSRFTRPSALRARWLSTCPLVQPGSALAALAEASSMDSTSSSRLAVARSAAPSPAAASRTASDSSARCCGTVTLVVCVCAPEFPTISPIQVIAA